MSERSVETRQQKETLRTPFSTDIEAALTEKGLRVVHAFDHADDALDVQGTLRTITYFVAPADFQTVAQLNEGIDFLTRLDRTKYAETETIGDHLRKNISVTLDQPNPLEEPDGFRIGRVNLYEPAGTTTRVEEQTSISSPAAGMEHVYQAAGLPIHTRHETTLQQYVRHEILVYPRSDIAEAVAIHLTNPQHPHEGLLELAAHGELPTPEQFYVAVPFAALGEDYARAMMELSPLTPGQRRLSYVRGVVRELLGHAGHHH